MVFTYMRPFAMLGKLTGYVVRAGTMDKTVRRGYASYPALLAPPPHEHLPEKEAGGKSAKHTRRT